MYDGDSFWTLGLWGRVGLVALSAVLALGWLWAVRRAPGRWPVRAAVWAGAFCLFVWLSPQVYYLYYLTIFDGLPVQWVIRWPPDWLEPFRLLTLHAKSSLSDHGKALMGWLGLALVLTRRRG